MDERTPSFLFDTWRWPKHKELNEIYERLWEEIPKSKQNGTNEMIETLLKHFICNLYISHYNDKPIAVPLRKDMFARGRYKQLHFSYRAFRERVFEFLEQKGIMMVKLGINSYSDNESSEFEEYNPVYEQGCSTRIWPSDALRDEFSKLENVLIYRDTDCIVMREEIDETKLDIPFPESSFTVNLRSELIFINEVYTTHNFRYDSTTEKYKVFNPWYQNLNKLYDSTYEDSVYQDPCTFLLPGTNAVMRRFSPQIRTVFSNGSFEQGGRIYAALQKEIGNWQSMPQEQRKTILIDGYPVVELDFDAFHLTMLYAIEEKQLNHDPYNTVAPKEMRSIIKVLLLTALNAESEESAEGAMIDKIKKLKRKEYITKKDLDLLKAIDIYKPNWLELIDKLRDAHPLIAPYFCSGAGLMLQRLDAEIMREALIYLAEKNIPALPIHDSAIVAVHHRSELRTAMSLGYHYIFGDRFTCGISEK